MKRFPITVSAVALILLSTPFAHADVTAGLVAYYPFNGNANDESGNGHHGGVVGATLTTDRFGNPDSAYVFGGLAAFDYIEVPNTNGAFDLVDAWTLLTWAKPAAIAEVTPGPIIWKIARSNLNEDTFGLYWITGPGFRYFGTKLERASDDLDFTVESTPELYLPGEWHCVAGIYDGTDLKIYVDTVLAGSNAIGPVVAYTGPAALRIGDHRNSNHGITGAFAGVIDDIWIYGRPLLEEEILELCSVGMPDADADGVDDSSDLCLDTSLGDPVDANGCADVQVDGDGDGICDPGAPSAGPSGCTGSDNCPDDSNPGQEEVCDDDGIGDICDPDADDDGDPATTDCDDCDPSVFTGATELCTDGVDNDCDGEVDEIDAGADCDGDGVPNEDDNCPLDFNEFQEDLDGDGLGDVCDEDRDGDGVGNDLDNCPDDANPVQEDFDADGAGDVCDADADGDGLEDATDDLCLFTATDPEAGVPSRGLGKNRWAEMDGNAQFDTNGNNPTGRMFSIFSTGGCNCAQIIAICGYGQGHTKFGCSNSVMDWWTGLYDRDGEAPFQCHE